MPDPESVMACALLHVYSDLPCYPEQMPEDGTLGELAVRWSGE